MKKSILVASLSVATLFATNAFANEDTPMLGMANPAATYCIDQGGETKTVSTLEGEHGICILSDGTEVGQWEYFRQNQDAQGDDVMMGMANPASVFCEEQGGKLEAEGSENICVLPDGNRIEEWEFYRQNHPEQGAVDMPNMANPASVFCEEQGGSVKIVDTAEGQIGMCVMPDGSEIEEWELFNKHNK